MRQLWLGKAFQPRPEVVRGFGFSLHPAEDLSNPQAIFRQGFSTQLDLIRLANGDLMEVRFPEPEITPKAVQPADNDALSVLVGDMSCSMSESQKYQARNLIFAAYMDSSQQQPKKDQGRHPYIHLPYGEAPGTHIEIKDEYSRGTHFSAFIQNRSTYWIQGNNTASALERALELAAQTKQRVVNVLLVTDGQEVISSDRILKAKANLKGTEVNLLVYTVGEGSLQLSELAENWSSNARQKGGTTGQVVQQHLTFEDIEALFDTDNLLQNLSQKSPAISGLSTGEATELDAALTELDKSESLQKFRNEQERDHFLSQIRVAAKSDVQLPQSLNLDASDQRELLFQYLSTMASWKGQSPEELGRSLNSSVQTP